MSGLSRSENDGALSRTKVDSFPMDAPRGARRQSGAERFKEHGVLNGESLRSYR
jgi:hypothetical protein